MGGAVAQEVSREVAAIPELVGEIHRCVREVVSDVGDTKAEKFSVEVQALLLAVHVDANVAQAPDLERLIEQHATDVELRAHLGTRVLSRSNGEL